VIAVIARNRKGKTLTTDSGPNNADWEIEISGDRKVNPGIESPKSLFFGVDRGEGKGGCARRTCTSHGIGKAKTLPLINTDDIDQRRLPKSPKLPKLGD
jgi:hypothetical protein